MSRRYAMCYLMVFGVAWLGWRTLDAQQPPALLPPAGPGDSLPVVRPFSGTTITNGPTHDRPAVSSAVVGDNSQVRVDPAVRVEWVGPANVRVGQANDYTLFVRNTSNTTIHDVNLRVKVNMKSIVAANPKPAATEDQLSWDLGSISAREDRAVQIRMSQADKGTSNVAASVTFSARTSLTVRATEPMLIVKAGAPNRCQLGDGTGYEVTITNPGDGVAERVHLTAEVPDGMEHVKGRLVNYDIGNLQPGEKRTVQVLCVARGGGEQTCKASAEAEGGLKAADKATINVITPLITVETKGPTLRYLDRKGSYKIVVNNPGDASATNVLVQDVLPAGFKFVNADNGGRYDQNTRTVSWFVGEVASGQTRELSVELQAATPGEFIHEVNVQAARGIKASHRLPVKIEGISAILLSVSDLEDPIEVGGDTVYEVRITNTGTKMDTDIKLVCEIPDKMTFKSATGPTGYTSVGNEITFAPLPQLGPRSDAVYRITVKATTAGVATFKSRITSATLVDPVHKEEATRIYADQ